ncbi:anti-sigma factor [Roseomonas sp. M0104]|uniref:Anti-sigma factor n=1 Tax=Teichococcus coralli TaxID=2545983 RepID=A0A845BEV0_9PROT|nr:anti-sigma factor [Pseudoroseomonas coralli]MXP65348.1 anti-sigma factor [Pseudoroseomonas coralli]
MSGRPITEDDLHGLVDLALDAARQAEVEAWLAAHPAEAARVEAYRRQRAALREALAPVASEPVPPELNLARLLERRWPARPLPWRAAAAAVLLLGLGGAGGWWLRDAARPETRGLAALAQQAADSYAVYAPDRQRPVELRAASQAELVSWMSDRLGRRITVPDLSAAGYRLMGGRLVPTPQGPAALFMYDDDRGSRLVLLARTMPAQDDTPMSGRSRGGMESFTWAAGGAGYSLVGAIAPTALHPLADEVRRQMAGRSLREPV